ncbi:hypothetical protein IU433_29875 [Nocardia puris]|uniref:Uncharacterized protein n=1 Tax=Nocardia puris TaxID=208602 RepID=A0A366DLL2_9NOCA|nr:hypothetical protein [Nocardia puris]MBF6212872.1 hypothetical protein [Nocardia puris]MBF6367863.1 hypothetical protein [Nocardia puris]MBF6463212.1 hypothetical protein [Nocardia puris]RBO90118.1 hypothetical protein DFR74_1062 [Nocardia puris]
MKRLGPWLTLVAVAVLGLVLVAVNMSQEPEPATASTNSPAAPATSAPPSTSAPPEAPTARFPDSADYVGPVPLASGGTLTLAITVAGPRAIAYACDGATVESWLQGEATDGALTLTGRNGATLTGRLAEGDVRGELVVDGKRWAFTVAPVAPPAGLYVYSASGSRQSWIVDGAGGVTGVRRGPDGGTSPAPALAADGSAVIDGVRVAATRVSGGDDVN